LHSEEPELQRSTATWISLRPSLEPRVNGTAATTSWITIEPLPRVPTEATMMLGGHPEKLSAGSWPDEVVQR
jgi:hypothetical protein